MEKGVAKENGGVCSIEMGNGAEDVYSCKESDASSADHLVVMAHGILGSATDWKFGPEQFVQMLPEKVYVHSIYQVLFLFGVTAIETLAGHVIYWIFRRIGRRLFLRDDEGKPLRKKVFIEELVNGLSRVSWEKVDISFHTIKQKFAAHSIIQVKNQQAHADGTDVIQHMIDHFLS